MLRSVPVKIDSNAKKQFPFRLIRQGVPKKIQSFHRSNIQEFLKLISINEVD